MVDWWSETEQAIVECLGSNGPMSPEDLAQRVGISEGEATAFLCMLAREKKLRIRLVDLCDARPSLPSRGPTRARAKSPAQRPPSYAGRH
jgi:predicted ArsR family transcriptional regulator